MNLAEDLKARGLVEHSSAPVEIIFEKKRRVYMGADPTADSLHVGHLVPLMVMRRLAQDGHTITLLVGGGTGMIGDPKEKGERPLSDKKNIENDQQSTIYMDTRLGSSSKMYDTYEKNDYGAGAITTNPNK